MQRYPRDIERMVPLLYTRTTEAILSSSARKMFKVFDFYYFKLRARKEDYLCHSIANMHLVAIIGRSK